MSDRYRPATEDDRPRLSWLRGQAFNSPASQSASISIEETRVCERDGVVVAAIRMSPLAQFFGGRPVPAVAVASVMVAAEARGGGTGSRLLTHALREAGGAVATLFPSTLRTYRRCGFEIAGVRQRYRAPIDRLPTEGDCAVEPFDSFEDVRECYTTLASQSSGLLDRPDWWWRERTVFGDAVYRYLVWDAGRVTGYVVYTQPSVPRNLPYHFEVACRDLVWLDARAARTLLALVASNRALGTDLVWCGPPTDPIQSFIAEQDAVADWSFGWMTRLVDVRGALEARGWPGGLSCAFEIEVADEVLASNAGAYRVEIDDGKAVVSRVDRAASSLHVRTLAALYTGHLDPAHAARAGLLTGDRQDALTLAFAGPRPWMPDLF